MHNTEFSFIILTWNEGIHLPRLLESIRSLNAKTYVLDSGSEDETHRICEEWGITVHYHAFENHPRQWHAALNILPIGTPWVICLDADQIVTPELGRLLLDFRSDNYRNVDGIYFNRKNYFKGKWIRHGGYFPKYLLKMFRHEAGYSDLNENMDHRFIVKGKTLCWKKGYLLEENLKENEISFWIAKHNKYSDQLAEEEIERMQHLRHQVIKPNLLGSPDERNAFLKKLWWKMPRHIRPFLYFLYRMIFQLGILDGRIGMIYHFLQGFWFRMIIDIKIEEKLKEAGLGPEEEGLRLSEGASGLRFTFTFLVLFLLFYGFHYCFIGLTAPGGIYCEVLDKYLNYIRGWRDLNISVSAHILELMDYMTVRTCSGLQVKGRAGFILVYSCLGYGIMSLFSAFVFAYPKPLYSKIAFLLRGLFIIQCLNILRLIAIALYSKKTCLFIDHHTVYNLILYMIISLLIFLWLKDPFDRS